MPKPVGSAGSYLPALDGMRAIAVALVIAYHLQVPHAGGGLLGVGIFFTLSGFLITRLLLQRFDRSRSWGLRDFWIRRARRLMPALVLVLAATMIATAIREPGEVHRWGVQAIAALFYVANWHTIFAGGSYFDRFNTGPFDHLWSLAIEEQFYLVWPLLIAALIWVFRRRTRTVAVVVAVLAAASFVELSMLAKTGFDTTRAYEGTDTRAGGLLVGAVLALWIHGRTTSLPRWLGGRRGDLFGFAMLVVIGALVTSTSEYSMSTYRYGLASLSVATAGLLAVVCSAGSWVGRVLAVRPLTFIGERAYGIYLWHLPILVFVPDDIVPGDAFARGVIVVALTLLVASLSWWLVEDPIRRFGLAGVARAHRLGRTAPPATHSALHPHPTAMARIAVVTPIAVAALVLPQAMPGNLWGLRRVAPTAGSTRPTGQAAAGKGKHAGASSGTPSAVATKGNGRTSCTQVVHIGDSTSEGLQGSNYIPQSSRQYPQQLKDVGVRTYHPEISGARSIVETYGGSPNAESVVRKYLAQGYDGCWVFALGTNDAANQVVGGNVSYAKRIARLMDLVGDDKVMWVNVRVHNPGNPAYDEDHQQQWDDALVQACTKYPRMRVADWASQVKDNWFISDGIHFTTRGYTARAHDIARALTVAFPQHGAAAHSCLVRGS